LTYNVKLTGPAAAYCERVMALPAMVEWLAATIAESEAVPKLDIEF
jgi:glutathione S-transferase